MSHPILNFVFILGLLFACSVGNARQPLFSTPCAKVFAEFALQKKRLAMSADEVRFLENLLPELGGRAIVGSKKTPRWERTSEGHLRSTSPEGFAVEIRFVEGVTTPRMVNIDAKLRTLEIPHEFDWSKFPNRTGLIRNTFLGHPLYPFLVDPNGPHQAERKALGEPALVHREIQNEVIDLGQTLLKKFDKDKNAEDQVFLAVSPTGTGKSEIVRALLRDRLKTKGKGLYIVLSDQTNTVSQLTKEVKKIQSGIEGEPPIGIKLVEWGDGGKRNADAKTFEELEALVESGNEPVILVTTASSLRSRIKGEKVTNENEEPEFLPDPKNVQHLRSILKYWIYDEAHHAGALQIGKIFDETLKENPEASALLITATPDSRVQRMAGGRGFYTYLDTPEAWLEKRGAADRSPGDVMKQLEAAFANGDLVGFEKVRPLVFALKEGDPIYTPVDRGQRAELLDQHYASLFEQTRDSLLSRPSLFSVNSQKEALRLTEYLSRQLTPHGRKVAVYTSDYEGYVENKDGQLVVTPVTEILERYNKGEIHVLVSVDRLNEAVDLPIASCLVDLRDDPNPFSLTQRFGRVVRTAPGKRDVEIYLAQSLDHEALAKRMDDIERKGTAGKSKRKKEDHHPVIALEDYIALIREAGRIDFWNAPSKEGGYANPDNIEGYLKFFKKLQTLFKASVDFSRFLEALKKNIGPGLHENWEKGIKEIFGENGPLPVLFTTLLQRKSLNHADRILKVLELYGKLAGVKVSPDNLHQTKEYNKFLKTLGSKEAIVTKSNFDTFLPLIKKLSDNLKAQVDFSKVISHFRDQLSPSEQIVYYLKTKEIFGPSGPSNFILNTTIYSKSDANADKVLRFLAEVARLKGLRLSPSELRKPNKLDEFLDQYGVADSTPVHSENFSAYIPFLEQLGETFEPGDNFLKVTTAFKKDLDLSTHEEWDEGVLEIFEKKKPSKSFFTGMVRDRSTPKANKLVKLALLYAKLKGLSVTAGDLEKPKTFLKLFHSFGIVEQVVTSENFHEYRPFLETLQKTFTASNQFSKVIAGMKSYLQKEDLVKLDQEIDRIFASGPPPALLTTTLFHQNANHANRILTLMEFYSQLRGSPLSKEDFKDAKKFTTFLKSFKPDLEPDLPAVPVVEAPRKAASPIKRNLFPEYIPFLERLQKTFKSDDFSNYLAELRNSLDDSVGDQWDLKIKDIFKSNSVADQPTSIQIIEMLDYYAQLKGFDLGVGGKKLGEKRADILYKAFLRKNWITPETYGRYRNLLQEIKTVFKAQDDFALVTSGMRAALSPEQQTKWDERMQLIFGNAPPSKELLTNAIDAKSPHSANQIVRVIELYANLKGIALPDTRFSESNDYEPLLAPFKK